MAERATIKHTTMQAIADAIRAKTGKTGKLLPSAMADEIQGIATGVDTSDATLTSGASMLSGVTAYGKAGTKITGTIPSKAAANYSAGFAAKTIIPSGYYLSGAQTLAGTPQTVQISTSNLVLTSSGIVIDIGSYGWSLTSIYAIGILINTSTVSIYITPESFNDDGTVKRLISSENGQLPFEISGGVITIGKGLDFESNYTVWYVYGSITVW